MRNILQADPNLIELRDALMAELGQIVETAQAEGTMRPDIGTGDLAVLFVLILRQRQSPGGEILGLDRAVAIMLDGLRRCAKPALPGSPITVKDLRLWPGPASTPHNEAVADRDPSMGERKA
ncbi:hypothetical protein [Nonomuraea insulae]|uniref:Transcriptional regulator SbtR-like C-terminal domain-containing protein n=1 Tax=Nonomuraea insulae TaxID=1616787 RepID=A0ABW1CG42_9ACTN